MALEVNDHRSNTLNPYRTYFSPPVILKYTDLNFEITFRRSNKAAIFHQNKPHHFIAIFVRYPCDQITTTSKRFETKRRT